MPINKNFPTRFRKYGQLPFTPVPNQIFEIFHGNADAIAMYAYLAGRPDNWQPIKADIMKVLGIGETRYKNAKQLLQDEGMWHVVDVRNEKGQIEGRVIWFNQWPVDDSTEMLKNHTSVKPNLSKTQSRINSISNKERFLQKKDSLKKKERAQKRAHPLPDDYWPTQEDLLKIRDSVSGIEFGTETWKFKNYYQANGKLMKDWTACWRNWIIRAGQYQEKRG